MRLALTLALIAVPALAMAAEDRYGPTPPPAAPVSAPSSAPAAHGVQLASAPAPYAGRFLQWPGKSAARAVAATPPAPVAAAPPPPAPPPVAAAAPPPLPTSLYSQPAAPAPPAPLAVASPPPAPVAPAAPAARVAMAAPAAQAGWVKPRFYSLHREYGDAPDAIPLPADRPPVLIGPASSPAADPAEDADPKPPRDTDGIY